MGLAELTNVDRSIIRFLDEQVAIARGTRQQASTSQIYLRNILRNRAGQNGSLPQLLANEDSDFLGGSFARHTKIWPLDDIDLYMPLDGGGLSYTNNFQRLPFTIVSDGVVTRLTLDQWQTGGYVDSKKVLRAFKDSLKPTYPNSELDADGHCVKLGTTIAATEDSDGLGFDVVPCFLLRPDDHSEDIYLVPDGASGWMKSNPRKDTDICLELNQFHQSTYRRAVRLVKQWNSVVLNNSIKSYYIELALCRRFNALRVDRNPISSVTAAFAIALTALKDAIAVGAQVPLVAGAPNVDTSVLSDNQKALLQIDTNNANVAWSFAFNDGQTQSAYNTLNTIFSCEFFG
jgi:hypothetical protein